MRFTCSQVLRTLLYGIVSIAGMAACGLAGPPVSVTLLDGSTRTGELQKLSQDQVDITTDQGVEQFPGNNVMSLDLTSSTKPASNALPLGISFSDQSLMLISSFETDGTRATLGAPDLPALTVPVRQISTVRFSSLDEKISARWEDLVARNARDDLLVIRKGDVLDYVAGSIGRVTSEAVTMLVRDKELSAPREKIFGLIYAVRATVPQARRIAVRTRQGSILQAETLQLEQTNLQLTLSSLGKISLPMDSIESLDYGGGRIRSLADLPFDQSSSKQPHDNDPVVWFVSRNAPAGSGGKAPLLIGTKEFRKGLWLHSGAVLRFRLNREYTHLRATAGFDLTHVTRMPRFNPQVRLVLQGDGKELYAKSFLWNAPPEQLDIDLTDVRELIVRIESEGVAQGILEHFALGDAQVIQ